MSKHFDIIIGSSPILLIEAVVRRIAGQSVLIIESDRKLNGAWKSGDAYNFKHDSGVHTCYIIEKQEAKNDI